MEGQRPLSLAFRITSLTGAALVLCFLGFGLLLKLSIEQHFKEQDADELSEVAQAVVAAINTIDQEGKPAYQQLAQAVSGHHGVYYAVCDVKGTVLFSSDGFEPVYFPKSFLPVSDVIPANLIEWSGEGKTMRGTLLLVNANNDETGKSGEYHVLVASDMNFHMQYMDVLVRSLATFIIIASSITLLVARVAVYQGHSPLRKLSDTIASITSDKLDVRVTEAHFPRELSELISTFNHMVERLQDVFERLSHFSGDIAHELRTPITNLTTQTQVALNQPRTAEEYQEVLYSSLEEYEKLARMIGNMLFLAKTDNGLLKPAQERLNIIGEIEDLCEYFELLAEEKHITLLVSGYEGLWVCDRSMLRHAMTNLLSNALRHAPEETQVTVTVESKNNLLSVIVSNVGQPIPQEHLPRLFDRFYRVDASRQRNGEGTGLGLAIVKSVVEAHNGWINVESDKEKTSFTITLPEIIQQRSSSGETSWT